MKIVDEAAGDLARRVPRWRDLVESVKTPALSASDWLRTVAKKEAKKQNLEVRDQATSSPTPM